MKIYHWVGEHPTWKVGNGRNVLFGIDPIIGLGNDFKLSSYITNYLAEIGYFTLAHIRRPIRLNMDSSYWYTAKYLGLVQDQAFECEVYIKRLNYVGCRIFGEEDSLIWYANSMTGNITAKLTYQAIV